MKNLFINKKTINTTSHTHLLELSITFDETKTTQEEFIKNNRKLIIDIKDTLLNRDNLTILEMNNKLNLIKESIEKGIKLPLNYWKPIGIRTDENDKKYLTSFIDKQKTEKELRTIEIQKQIDLELNNTFLNETTTKKDKTKKK